MNLVQETHCEEMTRSLNQRHFKGSEPISLSFPKVAGIVTHFLIPGSETQMSPSSDEGTQMPWVPVCMTTLETLSKSPNFSRERLSPYPQPLCSGTHWNQPRPPRHRMRSQGDGQKVGFVFCSQTTVCSVTKRPDFSETGQWDVVTETGGRQDRAVFDAVMVCTGHFLSPHLPLESYPGESSPLGPCLLSWVLLEGKLLICNWTCCLRIADTFMFPLRNSTYNFGRYKALCRC